MTTEFDTASAGFNTDPLGFSREQAELIERSGGTQGTISEQGDRVVVLTSRGAKTGAVRKVPLIRVEEGGTYCAVASLGGMPNNPNWYHNVINDPKVQLQDGPDIYQLTAREVTGAERELWWSRAVATYPSYGEYQLKTDRIIPVFVLEPTDR